MTDKVAWTYTEPKDKACWTGLKEFTDKDCKTAQGTATIGATGTAAKLSTKWYVVSCKAGEITGFKVDAADDDTKAKAEYDAATDKAVKIAYTPDKGGAAVPCTEWDKGAAWATFTASGYAAPANSSNSTNASGAKTLAAAFAAGALAVAATQF